MGTMALDWLNKNVTEAGVDEAGRGCLAGPVVAGAVILPSDYHSDLLNDSKQLNEKSRYALRTEIEQQAIAFGVGIVSEKEIDQINILNASFLAMHRALDQMGESFDLVAVDGNRFKPYKKVPFECVVKGDGKIWSIAAASILAKTYRDDIMKELHEEFPVYDWNNNKGYPTKKHRAAIKEHGACKYHRQSFKLLPEEQLELF